MYKYLLTSTKFTGELEFRFDTARALSFFENRAQMEVDQLNYLFGKFPFTEEELIRLTQGSATLTLAKLDHDITFDEFWKAYNYKVGNKARAMKLWNALTATDRALIMEYLPRYEAYLAARPRMEKLYPETFLNQRRWENELPK